MYISSMALAVIGGIDSVMVGSMIGLKYLAIYSLGLTLATMLQIPFRSISLITSPIFSQAWKDNDLKKIREMNTASGLNIMLIGSFLFLLLWCNMPNVVQLLPVKYQVPELLLIVLFLGAGKWFDMITGLNSEIILTSPYYRFTLVNVSVLGISTVALNVIFISRYGVTGAAIATCLTLFLFNLSKLFFLLFKFGMQPFSLKGVWIIGIALLVWYVNTFVPVAGNWLTDGILRTSLISILFLFPVILFKLAPDLNIVLAKMLRFDINLFGKK